MNRHLHQQKPRPHEVAMLRRQLTEGLRGILDSRVIDAVTGVPRQAFVPDDCIEHAYDDGPLPIGHGQTISQPYVVGFMTEALKPKPTDRILEVGVGSGYQTAVLAGLVQWVYGVEIVEPLAVRAGSLLHELGVSNVSIRVGDGSLGWSEEAPFDGILAACAANEIPEPLIDQLAVGGRMIIPVGGRFESQHLRLLEKSAHGLRESSILPVRFVPMTGLYGCS